MSPAGISVLAPMCLPNSLIKATQNLRISLSDLPFGSKSAPPLPPPILTVKECPVNGDFLEIRYCIRMLTASQRILKYLLKAEEFEN